MRCLLVGLILIAAPATAATIVVDNDFADCPQATFTSINLAVAAATPGDKILVCPGVYSETVLVDKPDLRIEAQAAPGEVVLQGSAAELYGFHLRTTTGVLVQGFTVRGFAQSNIIIEGGSGNTLRKNVTTAGVIDGIEVINSTGNVVDHNTSFGNLGPTSDGIFLSDSSDNIISHNETSDNGQHGINLFGSPRNAVFGNRSHHNAQRGIQTVGLSHANVLENNHAFANRIAGMAVSNSTEVRVRNNRSENNGIAGIAVNGAANNLVEKNELFQNAGHGVRLLGNADSNIVRLNLIRENGIDGIRVEDTLSAGNTFERNVIHVSGEHDAHDNSTGPGTGNTANFWIENKCETENRPGLCKNP